VTSTTISPLQRTRQAAPWTILVDTREQTPWPLQSIIDEHRLPFLVETATLRSGDYTVREAPFVVIERKSLQDLVGCVGHGRDRFERELRMRERPIYLIDRQDS